MDATLARLETLVAPSTGLIDRVCELAAHPGETRFQVQTALLGDINQAMDSYAWARMNHPIACPGDGSGSGLTANEARLRAIAEALERYASCVYDEKQFVWATGAELGQEALDLDTVPKCSDDEYSHPSCPVVRPDKHAPIRWVRGVSLHDGRATWIPAVLSFLNLPALTAAERFCLPISTGCAAHVSVEQALLSGLCEVIERDAVSLTWLQRLALPRIVADASEHFFDATTDLGVPTLYCVQVAPHSERLAVVVGCDAGLDASVSLAKLRREVASCRIGLQMPRSSASDRDAFLSVYDGALYMARPERLEAFGFLLKTTTHRTLAEMPKLETGSARRNLLEILGRLRRAGYEAYAVDLTTDEACRVGMRVVRVVVPGLMPLSFSYRARFLGHSRLYDAPRRMGHPVQGEADINPWPQPFA